MQYYYNDRSSYFQYIYPFNQADLGSDDLAYTMNIWWKPISFESEQLFFQFGTQILQLGTEEYTGKMYFTAGGLQSNNTSIISGPLNPIYPQFNQWQFLSVRKSPMVFEIFINLQLKCILDFTSGGAWPEIFPNFQIGASGSSVYTINLFRDMTFYKIKLSDSELQSVMQEIGDVKTQKLNMLRYFKLHKQLNRQIQQDYSIYGRHLRTNINCKYVTDPDMESQIQEALINKPKKYMVLTNQAATDIQISKPLHPTIFSSFSVELWIQFQSFPSSSVILRDDSPIPGNTQESDNFQIKASSNNILDVNLYTSTFLSQPSFTSSQNLYPSVGPAWRHIYLGVNTISKEIQVSLQFSMTTHSEAALTFCPLLISYWRLKPYNDYQSLEDTSLNQQFRNQASALNYVYDETFPVICTVDHIYDESTNSCITKVNSKERIFTISSSSTALVHLDTTNIGPDYLLEFWYYTKVDDFTLIEHNKFTVSLSSGTQVKLTYTSNSTTLPLAIKHDVTQWNHFLILFSSGAQDYINFCLNISCLENSISYNRPPSEQNSLNIIKSFSGYVKEMRLWTNEANLDLHNYVHYYKNRIYNNYELAPGLRDYLRFVKTTSALNSVDFQMHYAQKTSGTHPLQINPSATIATTRISWKDNLQECDLGYSFNGIVCKANSASIRAIQPASLQISQLNSSASPIDYFQISFHFRLTERIMSLAYSGVCIHLQSAPTYLGGKRFIEFQSSADQGFLISIAGANMVYSMTSNQYFKANHWYSFFSKYSATSSTVFRSFIAYDFRSLIGEYEQDTGNSTISLDNSINHQIYFGYANTPQTPNCDPDFSIRDFWLSQQNNLSQITLSQFLNGLRTRHQALQVSSVYLAFNESEGYLVYDYNNPNPMLNLRSGNNFIAWEWDPILFKMCDGPYEVYYQYQQYYCGVRQFMRFNKNNHQITIGDLSRGAQNQITDTYTFSITFHLRIQSDANVPQTQIFILNPTNSGGNQMIFNFNHKYLPGVYYYCQNGIDFHGYQNTVASDTDQVCSLIVNAWGLITVIKDGLTYKFYCNYYLYASYTVTNSMFPFNFDDKIKLGGSSPGYQTMNGYMRQFKYYDDLVLSTTEIINDYTLYQMVQASSSIYYSLEIHNQKYNFYLIYNKFSYMIMNEGLIRDNLIQQQDDTNYPHLVPFNSFDTTGYYYNQGSTYKWLSTTVISTLTLSGGNEWTLDMRLSLQDSLSQDLFHINGFIYLRGQSDRKLRIILGSNPTAYITKNALINLDQYQQYVFIQRIGGTGVTFILDGIIQELIPQTTSLPSTPVALKMPNNDVALKDIRIWNKAMPYNFVNQLQQKIIDGTYYPNLLYYFISRTPEHRYFFKFFRQGQYSYEYHGPYSSAPFQDSYFCLDYQVFDGYSCQTFKYVVLDSTNFKDLVLKTPQATHILTPTSVTLEFWILLHETKNAGQIVTIIDINNVAMTLQENSLFQVTVQTTGPAQIVSDRSSASSIDDFKYTYWRKVVMVIKSTSQKTIFQSDSLTNSDTLSSKIIKEVIFCQTPSICYFGLKQVMLWNTTKTYDMSDKKSLTIIDITALSDLIFCYPLDESQGFIFTELGPYYNHYQVFDNHYDQTFQWKLPHQISQTADHLLLISDTIFQYDSFSETLVGTTVPIARFYMSNQPVILQNQLSYTMSKDWSIDFWVKYGQKSGCGLNSINILSQMDDGICTIGDSNAARINIMINKISGQSNQLITEDLQNGTVPQNINQYRIVSQNVYFHVAIRNSQIQVISTLNFTNPIISQSFNPLSKCSFQIGYSTLPLDSHVYFQLKNLRIWSSAMTLDQIMMWSTSTITEQGFTDLVAYYKFDNEYLIDAISGQANVQSALATFDVVADNELTMNCPIGFGFDYDKRNCYHLDHQMLFYYQDSNFTWDLQPYIQNSIKDEDLSFTAYFYIWNQHQNYTFNVIRFCNIFQLYWRYNTYTLKFSWNDASFVSLPIIQGASTTYYNWFITFNMEDKQLLIVRNADVIFDLTISQDDILQFANISDWKMTYGYVNDIDEYPIQGFKQASLFQPPLSYQETQMIHSRQQHSQFMGQYGLKQNIRSEYNYAIYNSIFKTSLYDQGMKKYITTQSGTQIDNAQESICQPGSNKIQIFCVEASSLTIQGQILSLNATSILISRQFTFTGWFYIEHHDITSSTITFAQIDSLFSLEYTSFITLKAYQALMNYDHTSLALSNKQWYYMVVSLDNLDWKVQLNEQLIIQQQGQDIDYQTTPVNEIKIGTSSLKSVISVKELKLFGHSLDILELRENMYTHTMKDSYYNQMMVYYPLAETGRNIIQDISKESRLTTIPNQQGIFWSYVPRGEISTNQNALASVSSGKNAYITKDKSLFFEKGTSAQYVLGQTILRTRFTISLFANFQDFTIFAVPQTFLSLNPGLLQIRVSSTQFRCLISDDTSSLFAINGPTNQWIGLICGISDSLKSGYFYQFQTQLIDGITIRDTFTPSPQAFQINQLTISGFDGYLKEIKIFSELIDPHVMMKYSRQVNYPDYSGVPMQFYIRINEAFGQKIYESVSQQDVAIQTSIAGVFPYWSKSSQELIICEGHSKYIMQYDYCQRAEKFAKIDPAFPFSFTIAKDEMQNSTTLVWVLFKHFGYDPISLEMSLQERFTWSIMKNKTGALLLANSSYKLYGRRDESDIISGKKWVLFINRIIYPQGVVHNYLGRPTQISQSTTDIELTGTLNTNAKLLFTNNTSGLLFQILTGTNSEIFFRNLQLWNSVFTLDVAKQRAIRGANPYRFADTLVALFRLDESGGDSLFNTASFQRESNPRLIQDPTSSGTSAGLLRWVYYKEIDANPTTDSESVRNFLFCLEPNSRRIKKHCEYYKCHDDCVIDDCIGPALDECINCNQTGQQLILPDPLDCVDCNPKCSECQYSFINQDCITCTEGYILNNGKCGTDCPLNQHFKNATCVSCSNLLCICPEDNLTACSECADPSNYYILKNQTCITGCPNNLTQFYDTQFQDCLKCHAYCLGCTGPTNAECINCKSPYLRFGSVCGSADCPTNAFFDYNIFECVTCESPCETCIGNPYNCITCIEGYAFDNDGLCTRCSDLIGFFEPWYKKYTVPGGGVCTEICGDGLDFQNYPCDDGNLNRGDGCDQNCNIERDHSCEGGNIMKPDFCFDNKGPAFSIDKISGSNKAIYLKFDEKVVTDYKRFTKSDLIIIIKGKEGNLEFDANSAVTDILNDSGKIIVSFSQQFSILEEKTVSIEIGFKNKSAFRDENGNPLRNQISQAQYLGTYEFVNSEQEAQARQLGQTASTTSLLTMIINFVIQNLLGKALGSIWVAMNSCQIIYYMPLMAVPYPKLLKVYLKYLDFANVQDDFMGKPFFYKYLYLKQVKDEPVNESYEDYGFESSIFFFSYANKIQGWGILMCAYPLILLGSYALKFKAFDFLRRIEKSYRFNGLWRLLTELYLEMTLNAFMNIYSLQFGSKTQLTISVMALIFMGFLTYLPGFTFTIINANAHRFQQKTTEEKHGVLYEGTRIEENKSINQMYIPIFLFRRLTYVFILVLLKDYPTYQLTACVFKNFCYLMFFVTQMPFKEKMLNYQHIMNETLTGIAFAVSFVFTKTSTQHDLDFYSNMILGVVVLILGFNFLLVAFDTLKGIVELIKNFKVKVQGLKDRIKALINLLRNKKVELNETTESSQNVLQQNGYKPNINTRFDQQIQGDFETQQEDEQFHNISGQRGGHRKYERLRGQMILNSEQKMIPNSPQSVLMIQKRRKLLQQMQDGLQDGDNIISNKIGTRMRQMSANYYNNDEFYPQKDAFKDNSRVLQQKSGKLQVKLLNTKDQQLMNDYVSPQKHLNIGKDLNSTINQNNTQENLMFNIHGNHLNESKDVKDLLSEMKYDDRNNDDVSFEYLRGDLKLKRKLQNQLKNRIDMKH